MDAREKYEARAKLRKSIDLTQAVPDDPLQRSLYEQKQQEREKNTHRRTHTTIVTSSNNTDNKQVINDILANQDSRSKTNNLEVKMENKVPILFVHNRIDFGKSHIKVSPKIVIKKDEPVKLDRPQESTSEATTSTQSQNQPQSQPQTKLKRDLPDVEPLSRRLVNDKFNLNASNHLQKQYTLPSSLDDLNNSIFDANKNNNPLNSTVVIQESIEKSLKEEVKSSFKITESVVFKNNELRKDVCINPVEDADKKVYKFNYVKSYVKPDKEESILTSPSTSASSNPTPSKKDTFDTPVKAESTTPVKIAGKLNYEQAVVDESVEEKLKMISKVKED